MIIEIGTRVLSTAEITDIPLKSEGIVTAVELNLHVPDLYEVTFGDRVRYLYNREFTVLKD